jgi:hypothetical protein
MRGFDAVGRNLLGVIAGLDPAIHLLREMHYTKEMGPRVKPAGDAVVAAGPSQINRSMLQANR